MKTKNPNVKFFVAIGVMAALIIALVTIMIIAGTETNELPQGEVSQKAQALSPKDVNANAENFLDVIDKTDAKKVEFTMENGKKFTIEVYPKNAPITCENFLTLVADGFYDGLTFHRVIEGFMAQGGAFDPVDQSNDPAKQIKGEFKNNGIDNTLSHQRGVVSMARQNGKNDSASSQFFICYDDASFLDGDYAAFGYVTEGMDTIDSFLEGGMDEADRPKKEIKIKSAQIVE